MNDINYLKALVGTVDEVKQQYEKNVELKVSIEKKLHRVLEEVKSVLWSRDNPFNIAIKVDSDAKAITGEAIYRLCWLKMHNGFDLCLEERSNSSRDYQRISKPPVEKQLIMIEMLPKLITAFFDEYKRLIVTVDRANATVIENFTKVYSNLPEGFQKWLEPTFKSVSDLKN